MPSAAQCACRVINQFRIAPLFWPPWRPAPAKSAACWKGLMCWPPCAPCRLWGAHIEKHDNGDWHVTGVGPMVWLPRPKRLISAMPVPVSGWLWGWWPGPPLARDLSVTPLYRPARWNAFCSLCAMGAQAQATNGCLPVMIEPAARCCGRHHARYRLGAGQISHFIGRFRGRGHHHGARENCHTRP